MDVFWIRSADGRMTYKLSDHYMQVGDQLLLTAAALSAGGAESQKEVRYGISVDDLKTIWKAGRSVEIAQLYELVIPGLIMPKHVFKGLRRRLYSDDSPDSDKHKLVYCRRPAFDAIVTRSNLGEAVPAKKEPPAGKTFVVIVSPNLKHQEEYKAIAGWIERWNWVQEDPGLPEAPLGWLDRYDQRILFDQ